MLLVYVSFALKRRIGQKNWRRLHWATYATFAMGTAHGLMAGSDSGQPWALALYLGAVGSVAFATGWRALVKAGPPPRPKPAPRPQAAQSPAAQTEGAA